MGFDLTNESGNYLRFSPSGWALALTLAENYGWQPEGTTLAVADEGEPVEWSGEYATNEGQRVSASDAQSLADACERALGDPQYESQASEIFAQINVAVAEEVPGYTPEPVNRADMVKFRERLGELVTFCREGSFVIE
jgi:hypothetical protein